jgi:hypothetical protein
MKLNKSFFEMVKNKKGENKKEREEKTGGE